MPTHPFEGLGVTFGETPLAISFAGLWQRKWVGPTGLAVAIAVTSGIPSAAAQTAYAVGEGSPNNIQLTVPVTATVGGQCGFSTAPNGSHHDNDLTDGIPNVDFPFVLECTVASRVAIVSSNGGLKASAGVIPVGYTDLVPYNVLLNLVGDSVSPVSGACAAASLSATSGAPCSFRGPASTTVGMNLPGSSVGQTGSYVRVSAPGYTSGDIFVASNTYADTLTVTVSASP